jgi:hypothetical protein
MEAVIRSGGPVYQAARFAWHFAQMFIAMMLGMLPLFAVLGFLGIYDLSKRQPELFASLMALSMVLPMAAWMRFRMGHGWARTTEMSVAMIAPTAVVVPLCLAGFLPHSAAVGTSHVLMPVAMLADMAYRWRDYAQHQHATMTESAHTPHHAAAITDANGAPAGPQGAVR